MENGVKREVGWASAELLHISAELRLILSSGVRPNRLYLQKRANVRAIEQIVR